MTKDTILPAMKNASDVHNNLINYHFK